LAIDSVTATWQLACFDEFRKWCFEGLESIRKYQEEKARWDKRKIGDDARLQAIAETLPMLDDKDPLVRGQAARALGTLGAIEQMPRLIRMLKDSNPSVRESAQKALDQLNTPSPAPAAGPPMTPGTNK
jgi:hypothetical protein